METRMVSPEEKKARTWAMLCHLAGLAGCFLPWLAHLATPLIVWLLKRNDHPFIDEQGKESLNFQISMTLYSLVGGIALAVTIVGLVALPFYLFFLYFINVLGSIAGAIKTSEGVHFRYPLILRLVR